MSHIDIFLSYSGHSWRLSYFYLSRVYMPDYKGIALCLFLHAIIGKLTDANGNVNKNIFSQHLVSSG